MRRMMITDVENNKMTLKVMMSKRLCMVVVLLIVFRLKIINRRKRG